MSSLPKSYRKGDAFIEVVFLDPLTLSGNIGKTSGTFHFVQGVKYLLPADIGLELQKQAYCYYVEKIENPSREINEAQK